MAIKIRCSECDKRIVIDEAFAGGVCRCPFCTAIVMVPGGDGGEDVVRPGAPIERPAEPGSEPVQAEVPTKVAPSSVPMARADRTMTFMAAGTVALLVLVLAGAIVMVVLTSSKPPAPVAQNEAAPTLQNEPASAVKGPAADPFKTVIKGPAIAGDIQLVPPIVYVLDGGQVMTDVFDKAVAVTRVSVLTLGANDKFTVLVSASESDSSTDAEPPAGAPANKAASGPVDKPVARTTGSDLVLPGGFIAGGTKNEGAFGEWIRGYQGIDVPNGKTDIIASLDAALRLKPRTIVLFTLKDLCDEKGDLLPEVASLATRAKSQRTAVVCIGLPPGGDGINITVQNGLTKFAQACGSQFRNYDPYVFEKYSAEFERLNEKGTN